jgi:UDP-3-O-[3-hydroxymyristoyl] glucosamine N-acyltransferase
MQRMEFTVDQIAGLLNGEVKGAGSEKIFRLAKIQDARKGDIAFLSNPRYEPFIYTTQASAVIVKKDFVPKRDLAVSLILVDDPYLGFTRLLEEYHKLISFQKTGVEQPSFMDETSTAGDLVYRGAFSYIGRHVKIGNNVKIYPHSFIGDGVTIGDNTIIHSGVKIYAGVRIGSQCEIHSGAVVGSAGFGFAPQPDGTYKAIPQMGNVIIENQVSIGANTVIDCATFYGDATLIREGVKMDNLIQIAHNVEVGKNTVIAAQSGISGSTKVGENCVFGGQVGIAGHLVIAGDTHIGAQAGIGRNIEESGQRLLGSPAFDIKDYWRSYAIFKKLPALAKSLHELEKRGIPPPKTKGKTD